MQRKEQPRDPHTGRYAKEYVFDLEDTRIPEQPTQAHGDVRRNLEKIASDKKERKV